LRDVIGDALNRPGSNVLGGLVGVAYTGLTPCSKRRFLTAWQGKIGMHYGVHNKSDKVYE